MRKFFISADMEGCAGVSSRMALMPDRWHWEWQAARRWMTAEVVAVAEAALEAGYDEVIVADSHGNAHNIDPDLLPDNVWLVRSWPRRLLHMQGVDDPDVEACAFVGYHGSVNTRDSILAHTFHGGAFRNLKLNGVPCSEGRFNAALAAEFGCPVILVSGDQHTLEEAKDYAPNAMAFQAKTSFGERTQMALPPAQVCRQLKDAAQQALARELPSPRPMDGPYEVDLEMSTQTAAEMLAYLPWIERAGPRAVQASLNSMVDAVAFVSFAMLYTPTGETAL